MKKVSEVTLKELLNSSYTMCFLDTGIKMGYLIYWYRRKFQKVPLIKKEQ